jgi:hypothetical protein
MGINRQAPRGTRLLAAIESSYDNGTTKYWQLSCDGAFEGTEAEAQLRLPAGTAQHLRVYVSNNTLNGTCTFTFRRNGTSESLAIKVGASATGSFTDDTHSVALAADDLCCWQVATAGSSGSITIANATVLY